MEELKIIIPSVLVIIGWFISNSLATWRDLKAKRVELRFKYLLEAHRALSSGACRNRSQFTPAQKLAFESAIEDIQLLGNDDQIAALLKVINTGSNDFNPLILAIRQELREAMNLPENQVVKFYRLGSK